MKWEVKKLGEVCTLQRGFDLPTHSRKQGIIPLVSSSGIIDSIDECRVAGPGVITGRSGSIGNVFFVEKDYWPLNTTLYVKDFHGNDPRFIFHLLRQIDLRKFSTGTGVPTLNRNFAHEESVSIPNDIVAQRRIVAILDEAFAAIDKAKEAAERNLQNAREVFEGYLQSVFENPGDGWKNLELGALLRDIITGPFGSALHKSDYIENGIPVVNPQNIVEGKIVPLDKTLISSEHLRMLSRFALRNDDIVVARRGEMGRCAVVTENEDGWLCGTGSLILRLKENVSPRFVATFLSTATVKETLEKASVGTTMSNLNQAILVRLKIAVPTFSEQQSIVAQLDILSARVQQLQSIYTQKLTALEELKSAILQKAFAGGLTAERPQQLVIPAGNLNSGQAGVIVSSPSGMTSTASLPQRLVIPAGNLYSGQAHVTSSSPSGMTRLGEELGSGEELGLE